MAVLLRDIVIAQKLASEQGGATAIFADSDLFSLEVTQILRGRGKRFGSIENPQGFIKNARQRDKAAGIYSFAGTPLNKADFRLSGIERIKDGNGPRGL